MNVSYHEQLPFKDLLDDTINSESEKEEDIPNNGGGFLQAVSQDNSRIQIPPILFQEGRGPLKSQDMTNSPSMYLMPPIPRDSHDDALSDMQNSFVLMPRSPSDKPSMSPRSATSSPITRKNKKWRVLRSVVRAVSLFRIHDVVPLKNEVISSLFQKESTKEK